MYGETNPFMLPKHFHVRTGGQLLQCVAVTLEIFQESVFLEGAACFISLPLDPSVIMFALKDNKADARHHCCALSTRYIRPKCIPGSLSCCAVGKKGRCV